MAEKKWEVNKAKCFMICSTKWHKLVACIAWH